MATAYRQTHYYTPEEYLAMEREAEFKSEYFEGQIYAMAGASDPHNIITLNIGSEFRVQFKGSPCFARSSDAKIRSSDQGIFSYADVTVVCGQPQFHDGTHDVLTNPKVIVEVLSPSTERFDRGKKFAKYKQLESFTDYLLVAQDEAQIDYYKKQPDGTWAHEMAFGLDAEVHIASVHCTLRLSDVYDGISFGTVDEGETQE